MNIKLDYLFRFRDNDKFKIFAKIYTVLVVLYFFVVVGFFFAHKTIDLMVFMLIPALLLASFFRKNDYLFILAEFITVLADVCLILYHKRAIGFPTYILVQLTYAAYFFIRDENRKRQIIITIIRPIAMGLGVLVAFAAMKSKLDLIMAWAVMYYVNLLINIVCAICLKDPLLIVGFSIFALSDLIIGLDMLLPSSNPLMKFLDSFNFMHFFYLTSQVILIFNNKKNIYTKKYICLR